MNELHLFAGAGGGILGGMLLGHTTVCAVEIEEYPRKVLLQRQRDGILPRFPIWDDVQTFDGKPWRGKVDILCGGFPCQDISIAGKGAGIDGKRSGMWGEMARIVNEIRPRYVFVENSPMLIKRGLTRVLGDLAQMGYDARWCILGGEDCGAPHKRKRLWLLAFNSDQSDAARIKSNLGQDKNTTIGATEENKQKRDRWQHELEAATSLLQGESYADFMRGVHGMAEKLDTHRFSALGNGQIPQVAARAFSILSK